MKRKYYMRGIGISMIVTAILMGIATDGNKTLSDEEIKARALQLGMIEAKAMVLSDLREQDAPEPTIVIENQEDGEISEGQDNEILESNSQDSEIKYNEAEEEEATDENNLFQNEVMEVEKEETSDENAKKEEEPEADVVKEESATKITIVVERGDSSDSVSRDLEASGLIEDAKSFDRYLCNNGYSKRISIGTYEIEMGTDEEKIAKIITRSK